MNSLIPLCLHFVLVRYVCCQPATSSPVAAVAEPLLLTPLIFDGSRREEARNLSRVEPLIDDVKSYSGYLTADRDSESHLYFWFFPKTTPDNGSAPLVLWLQGGPGSSSLHGLFCENGPFQVTKNNTLKRRKHAWTNNYHMLYIDQPVGAGYSFTKYEGYVHDMDEVAQDLYAVLLQFFMLFPEFRSHDFYIAGESYAGKYIPVLGHMIHEMNQDARVFPIPLKGFIIRNAFSDPENMLEFAAPLRMLGLLDRNESRQIELMQDKIKYLIKSGEWLEAGRSHRDLLDFVMSNITDYLSLFGYESDAFNDESYVDFVTKEEVRQRIHVDHVEFNAKSAAVASNLEMDRMQSVQMWIEALLEYYPMVFYNGEFDIQCAPWMTEYVLEKLHWSGAAKYAKALKQTWKIGYRVAGYYKTAGNLTYVSVRNAGDDQQKNTLNLVDSFIGKKFRG